MEENRRNEPKLGEIGQNRGKIGKLKIPEQRGGALAPANGKQQ